MQEKSFVRNDLHCPSFVIQTSDKTNACICSSYLLLVRCTCKVYIWKMKDIRLCFVAEVDSCTGSGNQISSETDPGLVDVNFN